MEQKVGATTSCYTGFDLDEALAGISKAGLKYAELSAMFVVCDSKGDLAEHVIPENMNDDDIDTLKKKLRSYSLLPMSISGHVDLIESDGVTALKRRIDLAKKIGAGIVNTKTGDPVSEKEVNIFYRNVQEIAEYTADENVLIGLETSGKYFNTAKKAVAILEKIRSDHIRLNYDTANVIYYEDVRPEVDIEYGMDYLVHIHVKDKRGGKGEYDFPALGRGTINFEKIFTILSKHNYKGPLSIEIEFDGKHHEPLNGVDEAVIESCNFLKQFVQF